MGLLTDTNFSGAGQQGAIGAQKPSIQSMLAQRLMQNAMQRRQANPLSQTLSTPPPGLDMMPGFEGAAPRQPVGALPGGTGAMGVPGASAINPMSGMQESALSNFPKSFAGMGMGETAPKISSPSDSMPLSQISGGMSSKMGDSFSAPSAAPMPAGTPSPNTQGLDTQGLGNGLRMQMIMQMLNSMNGGQ